MDWVLQSLPFYRAANWGSESFGYLPQDTQLWYMEETVRTSDLTSCLLHRSLAATPRRAQPVLDGLMGLPLDWGQGGASPPHPSEPTGLMRSSRSTGQYMKEWMNHRLRYPDQGEGEGKVKKFPEGQGRGERQYEDPSLCVALAPFSLCWMGEGAVTSLRDTTRPQPCLGFIAFWELWN